MKRVAIALGLSFLTSCGLPEIKELSPESKKELDTITSELKLEKFEYSFHKKSTNGVDKDFFSVRLSNIDDTADFKVYNDRIISAFEKSGYDFSKQDFIRIGYFRELIPIDLYVYYEIDPKTKQIINEGYE